MRISLHTRQYYQATRWAVNPFTESRFRRDPTDLQLKVDTAAVATALASGAGEQAIRDYRGVRVLSSFERFELLGTTQGIIAEIDEAIVLTPAESWVQIECNRPVDSILFS